MNNSPAPSQSLRLAFRFSASIDQLVSVSNVDSSPNRRPWTPFAGDAILGRMTPSDPHDRDTPERTLFGELRGRKVFQAAAIYGAVAWGFTEITVTVVEQLFLPQWVSTLAVIGFVVGFPVAMFLSWTFDITSEGIHRTAVSSRRGKASIALSMLLLVAGTAGIALAAASAAAINHLLDQRIDAVMARTRNRPLPRTKPPRGTPTSRRWCACPPARS